MKAQDGYSSVHLFAPSLSLLTNTQRTQHAVGAGSAPTVKGRNRLCARSHQFSVGCVLGEGHVQSAVEAQIG